MYDSQIYNEKIPSYVLAPMLEFTQSDCLLVKKRRRGANKYKYRNYIVLISEIFTHKKIINW